MTEAIAPPHSIASTRPRYTVDATSDNSLRAAQCAQRVGQAFAGFHAEFRAITTRARDSFGVRDWLGAQMNFLERQGLFNKWHDHVLVTTREFSHEQAGQSDFWRQVRSGFTNSIGASHGVQIGHAFFDATMRRMGYDLTIGEPTKIGAAHGLPCGADRSLLCSIDAGATREAAIAQLLAALPLEAQWSDVASAESQLAESFDRAFTARYGRRFAAIQILNAIFYRFTSAYVVGRLLADTRSMTFVLALSHDGAGIVVEQVLTNEAELRIMFSRARAGFHVELEPTAAATKHLRELLPHLSAEDWMTILGYGPLFLM